jgi:hypothetical protein
MPKSSGKSNHKPVENKGYISAMREIRRSGAAGIHEDKRTKRSRSRNDAKRKAIGWSSSF